MNTFKQFLSESRRNPELNKKISVEDQLRPYKNNSNIYISFTKIKKIGINPLSKYNTPNGIYTYPLKEIWPFILNKNVPWEQDAPFIFILEVNKSRGKFIEDMYKDYSSADYDEDIKRIRQLYNNSETINEIIEYGTKTAYPRSPIGSFWNITRLIGTYEKNELFEESDNLIKKFKLTKVGNLNYNARLRDRKPGAMRWNAILRQLGYIGFADKSGKSLIHSSEPIQAVFLSKDAVKVIDMIYNYAGIEELTKKKEKGRIAYIYDKNWDGGNWTGKITIKNKEYDLMFTGDLWKDGTWKDGTWENGIWKDGTWENGTWKNGTWEKGRWHDGVWENGIWNMGIWEYGSWKDGVANDMSWHNGTWHNGTAKNITWKKGTWKNGSFSDGFWINGVWENGTYEYSTWYDGTWNGGTWKSGTWKSGTWNGGIDKYGNFHPKNDSPDKWK